MKELLVFVAKMMTKEQIIEKLEEGIANYKEAGLLNKPTTEAENEIELATQLFMLNKMDKDPGEIIKDLDTFQERMKFFDRGTN